MWVDPIGTKEYLFAKQLEHQNLREGHTKEVGGSRTVLTPLKQFSTLDSLVNNKSIWPEQEISTVVQKSISDIYSDSIITIWKLDKCYLKGRMYKQAESLNVGRVREEEVLAACLPH